MWLKITWCFADINRREGDGHSSGDTRFSFSGLRHWQHTLHWSQTVNRNANWILTIGPLLMQSFVTMLSSALYLFLFVLAKFKSHNRTALSVHPFKFVLAYSDLLFWMLPHKPAISAMSAANSICGTHFNTSQKSSCYLGLLLQLFHGNSHPEKENIISVGLWICLLYSALSERMLMLTVYTGLHDEFSEKERERGLWLVFRKVWRLRPCTHCCILTVNSNIGEYWIIFVFMSCGKQVPAHPPMGG